MMITFIFWLAPVKHGCIREVAKAGNATEASNERSELEPRSCSALHNRQPRYQAFRMVGAKKVSSWRLACCPKGAALAPATGRGRTPVASHDCVSQGCCCSSTACLQVLRCRGAGDVRKRVRTARRASPAPNGDGTFQTFNCACVCRPALRFQAVRYASYDPNARDKQHLNIGTIGHVDHGKTTLTAAITKVRFLCQSDSRGHSLTPIGTKHPATWGLAFSGSR